MFTINDDLSIYATRGDTVFFTVTADENGLPYTFQAGDVLRIKIFEKKNADNVVLEKDFGVTAATDKFTILLTEDDTKIGDVISKAKDYWYEIELNPFTNPQTIIGFDEDGAKIFKLFPEGADSEEPEVKPEDIPVVDDELDMTSTRPVENQAISRAIVNLEAAYRVTKEEVAEKANETANAVANLGAELATERVRIDNIVALEEGSTTGDAELQDIRTGADGNNYSTAGGAVRGQYMASLDKIRANRRNTPFFARYVEQNGYLNVRTGKITSYADGIGWITDFIPCESGDVYAYRGTVIDAVASVCWYDESYNFMAAEQYNTPDNTVEITVPAGVAFARFSSFAYKQFGSPVFDLTRVGYLSLGVEHRLDEVENKLSEVDDRTDNLANINVLNGKKWVACGDSYTAGDFSDFVDENGLSGKNSPVIYDTEMGMYKTYPWWIAKRNNMNLVCDAIGGSTMALSIEYVRGDIGIAENYRSPFSLDRYKNVPVDADYITLMFGLNEEKSDIGSLSDKNNNTVIGAWNIVLEYFLTNMPYAKIGIIIPDSWTSQKMHDALVSVAEYWGIPYLDIKGNPSVPMMTGGRLNGITFNPVAQNLRDRAFFVSDGNHHPNIKAHEYRSTVIENFLKSL